ncbi:DNA polymerase III subunit delta [Luteimonas sp. Y-2-2-4F]|nr:DNA polymerase III subunit delta [Luteimonas sp. Y-2-2-4F]MCD9031506.1 DNA polymerase III subunit delta [Luteimonas sp. Y-2-2-4F]
MELTPERLVAQLGGGPLSPAYLIAGPEPLRVLEAADALRARAREQGYAEREVFEPDGRDIDWAALEASLRAPSLFSARRVIEIRLPTAKPGKDGAAVIAGFCEAPPDDVLLLVTGGEWSRQHGGKWSEAVGRVGRIAIAWAVKPHEMPEWIERRLRARGLVADREAVQRLADRVEGNLLAAAQEIDKLALLADGEPLDAARMETLVADAARFDVFRLLDTALSGQAAQAVRMLAGLRAEGEAVPALMGMVVMELQRAAALARVQARGGDLAGEFRAQRVWDSKQAVYRRALQRHPAERWERFLAQAGRIDRIAKGRAAGDAWQVLERLLVAVAEPRAAVLAAPPR